MNEHTCVVAGKDTDGDMHRDERCLADTEADDCDDGDKLVFSGASEICDWQDNDCNGLDEFAEGAALSGTTQPLLTDISPESLDLVWAEELDAYALLYRSSAADDEGFDLVLFNQAGSIVLGPVRVFDTTAAVEPRLAWSKESFLVTWPTSSGARAQRVDENLQLTGDVISLSTVAVWETDVMAASQANRFWVTWFQDNGFGDARLYTQVVANGVPEGPVRQKSHSGSATKLQMESVGSGLAVGYLAESQFQLQVFQGDFQRTADESFDAYDGIISSGGQQVHTLVRSDGRLDMTAFDLAGAPVCGPELVRQGGGPPALRPFWIDAGEFGVTTVSAFSGNMSLQRMSAGCSTLGGPLALSDWVSDAAVARGSAGLAIVWRRTMTPNEISVRTAGSNLCD